MKPVQASCPDCGSSHTAARRELFHLLMDGVSLEGAFRWYDERAHRACPPKSLFVVLFLMTLGAMIPAMGFWVLEHYAAQYWLVTVAALLLACLIVDALLTLRRYKDWVDEWLCGDCQHSFKLAPVLALID
ncbi:MAG: hypothetical protein V7754_15320 [Halioglobus sp.]